ncbi:hypothetical protein HN935_02530 [archaeon]|nr:hypothetical protein [archaeon]
MIGGHMDKLEKAREMFRKLENHGVGHAAEIARRTFLIQDSLNTIRN